MRLKLENTIAVLVDVQERLLPHISDSEELLSRLDVLLRGLDELGVPIVLSEQYKKGLGETPEVLKTLFAPALSLEKVTFSCAGNDSFDEYIVVQAVKNVILFGIESHVCVLQTALDLLEQGIKPIIVTDAVSSRNENDKEVALQRMTREGAILTTTESILFELCFSSKNPSFKVISKLVK